MGATAAMSICGNCGHVWPTGFHGGHSCTDVMGKSIQGLRREIERLKKERKSPRQAGDGPAGEGEGGSVGERNKEQVYDDEISPLMKKILAICEGAGIAMVASFYIPTEQDPDLVCSSLLPDKNGEDGPNHKRAFAMLGSEGGQPIMHLAIEHADGSKTLAAILP